MDLLFPFLFFAAGTGFGASFVRWLDDEEGDGEPVKVDIEVDVSDADTTHAIELKLWWEGAPAELPPLRYAITPQVAYDLSWELRACVDATDRKVDPLEIEVAEDGLIEAAQSIVPVLPACLLEEEVAGSGVFVDRAKKLRQAVAALDELVSQDPGPMPEPWEGEAG